LPGYSYAVDFSRSLSFTQLNYLASRIRLRVKLISKAIDCLPAKLCEPLSAHLT
jgi:hypothetical protein